MISSIGRSRAFRGTWALLAAFAGVVAPAAAQVGLGTSFSYQGQVKQSGTAINGTADFQFRLFDAAAAGTQVGLTNTASAVALANGLFNATLDFGQGAWNGPQRYLEIAVRSPAGSGSFTTMSAREVLRAAPVAQHLRLPYAGTTSIAGPAVSVTNTTGTAIYASGLGGGAFPFAAIHADGGNVGRGIYAYDVTGEGIVGDSFTGTAVFGYSGASGTGLRASTQSGVGAYAENRNSGNVGQLATASYGVVGSGNVAGAYFTNTVPGGLALKADGLAQVKVLQILGGSDLAEPFDVNAAAETAPVPGMLVVIDPARPGQLRVSDRAYDTRIAGAISGANGLSPGMIMKAEGNAMAEGEHPVAMTGRVWVWCDASFGAIMPGVRLTSSTTAGHAMRVSDHARAPGAVVGKAMTSLETGRGMVLVLVNLQ